MFKRRGWLAVSTIIALTSAAAGVRLYLQRRAGKATEMPAVVTFRILLGVGDPAPSVWDGAVSVSPGKIRSIQGWRFRGADSTDAHSSWKATSGTSLIMVGSAKTPPPVLENGVVVSAITGDPDATFTVATKQCNYPAALEKVSSLNFSVRGFESAFVSGRQTFWPLCIAISPEYCQRVQ